MDINIKNFEEYIPENELKEYVKEAVKLNLPAFKELANEKVCQKLKRTMNKMLSQDYSGDFIDEDIGKLFKPTVINIINEVLEEIQIDGVIKETLKEYTKQETIKSIKHLIKQKLWGGRMNKILLRLESNTPITATHQDGKSTKAYIFEIYIDEYSDIKTENKGTTEVEEWH